MKTRARRTFRTANLGMPFEELLEYTNQRYMNHNEAIMCKQNTKFIPLRNAYGQIVSCKVEEKATVDFMGRYKGIATAIEAKHTSKDRISFSEVKYHQAKFLERFRADGYGFSGVIVSFKLDRFFLVPWPFWEAARSAWENRKDLKSRKAEKIVVKEYGVTWITPGKASVSADELPKEFEVKTDRKYGLPYLNKIDGYMNVIKLNNDLENKGKLW